MIGRREEIQLLKKAYESPYSEFVTVYEVAYARCRVQTEHRDLGYKAAVRKPEYEVLREVPHRMYPEGRPDAARIPAEKRVPYSADDDVRNSNRRNAVVEQMETSEYR